MSHIWNAKRTRETKCSIFLAKVTFINKKAVFTSKLGLNLRGKLVNCYNGAGLCMVLKLEHFGEVDQKYVGSFETC